MKNRSALLGRTVAPVSQQKVMNVLSQDPVVEHIHDVKATVMSAETFRFKAEVDFDGAEIARRYLTTVDLDHIRKEVTASPEGLEHFLIAYGEHIVEALGDEIDRIEHNIRAEVPGAKHVDLEAD